MLKGTLLMFFSDSFAHKTHSSTMLQNEVLNYFESYCWRISKPFFPHSGVVDFLQRLRRKWLPSQDYISCPRASRGSHVPPNGIRTGITGEVKNQVLSPHLPFLSPWYTQHSELGSPVSKMAEPKSEMGPSPWITVWMRDINHAHYFDYVVRLKKKKLSFWAVTHFLDLFMKQAV